MGGVRQMRECAVALYVMKEEDKICIYRHMHIHIYCMCVICSFKRIKNKHFQMKNKM